MRSVTQHQPPVTTVSRRSEMRSHMITLRTRVRFPAIRSAAKMRRSNRTFRQVAWANSFQGLTSAGLGVRARLPVRAFTLPDHLVVDIAHAW